VNEPRRGFEGLQATCVAQAGRGVVLTGPSGSGKSDLALRLILARHPSPFVLVADDHVRVERDANAPKALAPGHHAGLIEVRGMGLVRVPHAGSAAIVLAVALRPWKDIERYPEPQRKQMVIAGFPVPLLEIDASSSSAAARVSLALELLDDPSRLYGNNA